MIKPLSLDVDRESHADSITQVYSASDGTLTYACMLTDPEILGKMGFKGQTWLTCYISILFNRVVSVG